MVWGDRGDRGARVNSLNSGIIMTPKAMDGLSGPGWGELPANDQSLRRRPGRHPDEIAAFLMGRDGAFISGADLSIDGGVIASIAAGRYQLCLS